MTSWFVFSRGVIRYPTSWYGCSGVVKYNPNILRVHHWVRLRPLKYTVLYMERCSFQCIAANLLEQMARTILFRLWLIIKWIQIFIGIGGWPVGGPGTYDWNGHSL